MLVFRDWVGIVTNIGLLLGIILVVYELRQNSIQMESSAYQQRTTDLITMDAMVMESEDLARALSKLDGPCELEPLSSTERVAYKHWLTSHAHRMNNLLHQYNLGVLHDDYMRFIQKPMEDFGDSWRTHEIWQGESVVSRYRELGFPARESKECDASSAQRDTG